MAGGFMPGSNKTQIHVYRGSGASRKVTIIDVQEAIKTGDVTKDFMLQPGEDAILADKLYQLLKEHSA